MSAFTVVLQVLCSLPVCVWEWLEHNVAVETLERFLEVLSEFFKGCQELTLLLGFAERPVAWLHLINERLVDAINDRVQGGNGVL